MHVLAISATCGRHTLMERSLRLFLNQDYEGPSTQLIYNNSSIPQSLGEFELRDNQRVILINQHIDSQTGNPYTSLGAIYNDIRKLIDVGEYQIIVHWDDDDLFLPNHLSEGVKGLQRGMLSAYKPKYSWYRSAEGLVLADNTLEPSIFVWSRHISEYGYSLVTTEQHLQWVDPLKEDGEIFIDSTGIPTLIYNWGDTDIWTFKTSGDFRNPSNFGNYRIHSQDHGDHILTPWTNKQVESYYNEVKNVEKSKNKELIP